MDQTIRSIEHVPACDLAGPRDAFPIMLVHGAASTRKREAALLKAAQDGQLQIVKRAGHVCNLEQPEAFTFQVRTFAKRLSAATRR